VNNAATNPYYGHILDTDLGAYQKTVDVNVRGYFFASILGGRLMRKGGRGSIINVASVNAVRPGPLQGIYSITKGAVLNMTQGLRARVRTGRHPLQCDPAGAHPHQVCRRPARRRGAAQALRRRQSAAARRRAAGPGGRSGCSSPRTPRPT